MTDRHDFTVFSPSAASSSGADARRFVRHARSAALATLEAGSRAPFASLVAIATDVHGHPILLLSQLARHTRNLAADPSASLLMSSPASGTDPLTTMRVTLQGKVCRVEAADVAERFLKWNPEAEEYGGFSDFGFHRLIVDSVHVIAGFGRIQSSKREDYILDQKECLTLSSKELSEVNRQCEGLVAQQWQKLSELQVLPEGMKESKPHIALADGDGCVLSDGKTVARLTFTSPIAAAAELEHGLSLSVAD